MSDARLTRWHPLASVGVGISLAVLFGELSKARLGLVPPSNPFLLLWSVVLAGTWGLGLFLSTTSRVPMIRRDEIRTSVAIVCFFSILVIAFPVPTAVRLCLEWWLGQTESFPELGLAYAAVTGLYAAASSALWNLFRGGSVAWPGDYRVALLVMFMAGPLLAIQTVHGPWLAQVAAVGGLGCGVLLGRAAFKSKS